LVLQGSENRKADGYVSHRVRIPVVCPHCQWRHFLEVELEDFESAAPGELRAQLEQWVASRCPDHLGPILAMSKN
jgi:hypothetical protein